MVACGLEVASSCRYILSCSVSSAFCLPGRMKLAAKRTAPGAAKPVTDGGGGKKKKRAPRTQPGALTGNKGPSSPTKHPVRLTTSRFRANHETVYFPYPPCASQPVQRGAPPGQTLVQPRKPPALRFKTYWARNSVKSVFREAGFARCQNKEDGSWDVLWGKHLKPEQYRELPLHKRVNSFPGTGVIGAKDRLATLLRRFQRRLRDRSYDFLPETHILRGKSGDLERFFADVERAKSAGKATARKKSANQVAWDDVWICKPQGGSCGRGIEVMRTRDVAKLPFTRKTADGGKKAKVWNVQRYIHNPLLIDNKKFDIRCYVLVTSFNPLRVYLFDEGMVRLCTSEYTLDINKLGDSYRHLTNYSINKQNDEVFEENEDADGSNTGHKQSLSAFLDRLREEGRVDPQLIVERMKGVVAKTMIACESECYPQSVGLRGRDRCCFEVFGFDIMFDSKLNPYLLEVNIYPSMMSASPFDKKLKCTMLSDVMHIVGVPPGIAALQREQPAPLGGKNGGAIRDPLLETKEEFERARSTHFLTVYPTPRAVRMYEHCFESTKAANEVVKSWLLQCPVDPTVARDHQIQPKGCESEEEGEEEDDVGDGVFTPPEGNVVEPIGGALPPSMGGNGVKFLMEKRDFDATNRL